MLLFLLDQMSTIATLPVLMAINKTTQNHDFSQYPLPLQHVFRLETAESFPNPVTHADSFLEVILWKGFNQPDAIFPLRMYVIIPHLPHENMWCDVPSFSVLQAHKRKALASQTSKNKKAKSCNQYLSEGYCTLCWRKWSGRKSVEKSQWQPGD